MVWMESWGLASLPVKLLVLLIHDTAFWSALMRGARLRAARSLVKERPAFLYSSVTSLRTEDFPSRRA